MKDEMVLLIIKDTFLIGVPRVPVTARILTQLW